MFVFYLIFSMLMGLGAGIAMVKEESNNTLLNIMTIIWNIISFPILLPILLGVRLYIKK